MSFKVSYTGGFNPFDWKDLKCPICGASKFFSNDHAVVFCGKCNSTFRVRPTAGDPGCVIDCFMDDNVYAPVWRCSICGEEATFMDWQTPACPKGHKERYIMEKDEYLIGPWNPPKGFPKSYYLILKLGDYCSGWLGVNWVEDESQRLGFPGQKAWENFQKEAVL